MGHLAIFYSAVLGLPPPWEVTSVSFDQGAKRLNINIAFQDGRSLACPACGATGAGEPQLETWCHREFLNCAAYLHARVPSIACSCGVCPVQRPWCRVGSRFSRILDHGGNRGRPARKSLTRALDAENPHAPAATLSHRHARHMRRLNLVDQGDGLTCCNALLLGS